VWHPISVKPILILSFYVHFCLPSGLFPSGFLMNSVWISHCSYISFFTCLSYSHWYDHSNNIWRRLLVIQSSPASCHFLSLRSKYSPQRFIIRHCQSTLCSSLSVRDQISHTCKIVGQIVVLFPVVPKDIHTSHLVKHRSVTIMTWQRPPGNILTFLASSHLSRQVS